MEYNISYNMLNSKRKSIKWAKRYEYIVVSEKQRYFKDHNIYRRMKLNLSKEIED